MRMIPNGEMMGGGARKEVKLLVVNEPSDHFELLQAIADVDSAHFAVQCRLVPQIEEALAEMDSWGPSVVMVDMHHGPRALELIRTLTHRGVVVVALSEFRVPQLSETAQSYGAVGYFPKSENPDDIESLLGYIASVASVLVAPH